MAILVPNYISQPDKWDYPTATGRLYWCQDCTPSYCCDQCEDISGAPPPLQQICADLAIATITSRQDGPLTVYNAVPTVHGYSVLTAPYSFRLAEVPADALICDGYAEYGFYGGTPLSCLDSSGGASDLNSMKVHFPRSFIKTLNAAWIGDSRISPYEMTVQATWTSPPPPSGPIPSDLVCVHVILAWTTPHYP